MGATPKKKSGSRKPKKQALTQDQKQALSEKVMKLDGEELSQVVEIVKKLCKSAFRDRGQWKYQIILDVMNKKCYKALDEFIDECLKGAAGTLEKRKGRRSSMRRSKKVKK